MKKSVLVFSSIFITLQFAFYFSCSNDSSSIQNSNISQVNSEKTEEDSVIPVEEAPYEIPNDRQRRNLSAEDLSNIGNNISSLTQDTLIKITGEIDSNNLQELMTAINQSNYKIDLDLSDSENTTFIFNFEPVANLRSISFPKTMRSLNEKGLKGCTDLKCIIVDEENADYSSKDGVLFNRNRSTLICFPAGKNGLYKIPNPTENIDSSAFYNAKELQSVTVPSSVRNIFANAFKGCSKLKSLSFEYQKWKYQNTEYTLSESKQNAALFTRTCTDNYWTKK